MPNYAHEVTLKNQSSFSNGVVVKLKYDFDNQLNEKNLSVYQDDALIAIGTLKVSNVQFSLTSGSTSKIIGYAETRVSVSN